MFKLLFGTSQFLLIVNQLPWEPWILGFNVVGTSEAISADPIGFNLINMVCCSINHGGEI